MLNGFVAQALGKLIDIQSEDNRWPSPSVHGVGMVTSNIQTS